MKVVGGHMASISAILKHRVHMSDLNLHAQAMANIATVVPGVFPKGSGEGKTKALSAIWDEPDKFKVGMEKFVEAANGMAEATASDDMSAVGPAIKALGGSCKGCHDNFKEE